MEFQSANQILPKELQKIKYDLFILVAGYELRSIYLPQNYAIKADLKIALAFEEKPGKLQRKNNDAYLLEKGFRLITLSGEQNLDLETIFSGIFNISGKEHLNVLFDYSSMTKVWYSGMINYLIFNTIACNNVTVHFSYTPALHNESGKSVAVKINNRLSNPGKNGSDSTKPVALIIGLGLDKTRPEFIRKNLNPAVTYLLYADPSDEEKYVERVLKNNQEIIEQSEIRNLISFPLHDLEKTNEIITNLCLNLRMKYNVVMVPVGPKVFSLLALLLASRYPDINVIRVSSGANAPAFERIPCGQPLIYSVEFISDELDC